MINILLLGSFSFILAKDLSFYHNLVENDVVSLADQAAACPKYVCKTPSISFSEDTCIYLDMPASTYYAQPCTESSLSCQSGPENNSTCKARPSIYSSGFPGEGCQTSADCAVEDYQGCVNSICQGAPENAACVYTWQCNPGLTCNTTTNTCTPQLKIGETGCTLLTDCVNNAACNITHNVGTCFELGSFEPHDFVSDCSLSNGVSGTSNLCSSWSCEVTNNAHFRCLDPVKSNQQLPVKCTATGSSGCASSKDEFSGIQVPGDCECGYNPEGDSYCALFPGDPQYQAFIKQSNKWFQSKGIFSCNTAARFHFLCMKTHWDSDNYNKYVYYNYLIEDYPLMQSSLSCVLDTMLEPYAEAKKSYNAGDDDSSDASHIKLLAAFALAFAAF